MGFAASVGSNAWAVARSDRGAPLLAADPHRPAGKPTAALPRSPRRARMEGRRRDVAVAAGSGHRTQRSSRLEHDRLEYRHAGYLRRESEPCQSAPSARGGPLGGPRRGQGRDCCQGPLRACAAGVRIHDAWSGDRDRPRQAPRVPPPMELVPSRAPLPSSRRSRSIARGLRPSFAKLWRGGKCRPRSSCTPTSTASSAARWRP